MRSPSRGTDLAVMLVVLGGVAATAAGWSRLDDVQWRTTQHLRWFVGLWLGASLLIFARRSSPLGAGAALFATATAATGQFGALLAIAAIAWSAGVVGHLVLRRWPGATWLEGELVGLTLYGTVIGLLVHLPVNYPGVYALLLALPLLLGHHTARAHAAAAWVVLRQPATGGAFERLLGGAAVALATLHLVVVMMPELGYDALVTHLLLPARIAWDHVWHFDVDHHVWAVMPMLGDWLYTLGYLLAGEPGARFVNLGCILLLAALVHRLARWAGGDPRGATAAVLVYLATPLTLTESSSLFIESVWSCAVVGGAAAVFGLLARGERDPGGNDPVGQRRRLVVAGLLLGGAMAAKALTMLVLPVLALLLGLGWRRWLARDSRGAIAAGGVAFLAVGGLPYARAFVLTGNPVFPFYNTLFRSPHYPLEDFKPPPMFEVGTSWDVLWRITFDAPRYLEAKAGAAGFHWLLVVAPVALGCLLAKQRRGLGLLAVAAAITWLTFRQTAYLRYVFPSFVLAAAAAGAALGGALRLGTLARRGLWSATIAAITLDLFWFASGSYGATISTTALASAAGRDAWIAERRPLRSAVAVVNGLNTARLPVAFFCQPFGTGLTAEGLWTNWYNPDLCTAVLTVQTADEMAARLDDAGAHYLLLTPDWRDAERRALVAAVSDEVHRVGDVSIRRLRDEHRFRCELLLAPRFEAAGWTVAGTATIDAGAGARLGAGGHVRQQVAVVGGRAHRLVARLGAAEPGRPASARLSVAWVDGRGRTLHQTAQNVACQADAPLHSMDVVAPAGAVAAVVVAANQGEAPVWFESLSFRR